MTLTLTYDLQFSVSPDQKAQGQGSVSFEDRVETNGRADGPTDGRRRLYNPLPRANAVGKYQHTVFDV